MTDIKTILAEATGGALNDEVLSEIEKVFESKVNDRVEIHVEKALQEQDELYSSKSSNIQLLFFRVLRFLSELLFQPSFLSWTDTSLKPGSSPLKIKGLLKLIAILGTQLYSACSVDFPQFP